MPPLAARAIAGAALNNPQVRSLLSGKEKRIGNVGALSLVALALFFDVLQFLLTLTIIFSFFSVVITLVAYIAILGSVKVFFDKEIEFFGGRQVMMKCGAIFAPLLIELMPFLGAIPAITPGTVALIVATRLEDLGEPTLVPDAETRKEERIRVFQVAQAARLRAAETRVRQEITETQEEQPRAVPTNPI